MSIYKIKSATSIFKYLDENEIALLKSFSTIEIYKPGDKIINLGSRNRDFMSIESGKAIVEISLEGKIIPVANLEKGAIIGEGNFIFPVRRSANVIAKTEVKISRFDYKSIVKLFKQNARISSRIFAAINDSLTEKYLRTVNNYIDLQKP